MNSYPDHSRIDLTSFAAQASAADLREAIVALEALPHYVAAFIPGDRILTSFGGILDASEALDRLQRVSA